MVIKIGGRDCELEITWGKIQKALKKMKTLKNGEVDAGAFLIDSIWVYLKRGYLFKPYITKGRMINKITLNEVKAAEKIIVEETSLEGREASPLPT